MFLKFLSQWEVKHLKNTLSILCQIICQKPLRTLAVWLGPERLAVANSSWCGPSSRVQRGLFNTRTSKMPFLVSLRQRFSSRWPENTQSQLGRLYGHTSTLSCYKISVTRWTTSLPSGVNRCVGSLGEANNIWKKFGVSAPFECWPTWPLVLIWTERVGWIQRGSKYAFWRVDDEKSHRVPILLHTCYVGRAEQIHKVF